MVMARPYQHDPGGIESLLPKGGYDGFSKVDEIAVESSGKSFLFNHADFELRGCSPQSLAGRERTSAGLCDPESCVGQRNLPDCQRAPRHNRA
jgi:hypothetical protein